jgi:hypothetical protein
MNAIIRPDQIDPDPIRIEPRPCEWCCLTIDRHRRVDTPEGPEFFCADLSPDEMTLDELERRAELRRQEDIAWILARMDAMQGRPPEFPPADKPPPAYQTAASTIDAFRYLVGLDDPERLAAWLRDRPQDARFLLKLLENK